MNGKEKQQPDCSTCRMANFCILRNRDEEEKAMYCVRCKDYEKPKKAAK